MNLQTPLLRNLNKIQQIDLLPLKDPTYQDTALENLQTRQTALHRQLPLFLKQRVMGHGRSSSPKDCPAYEHQIEATRMTHAVRVVTQFILTYFLLFIILISNKAVTSIRKTHVTPDIICIRHSKHRKYK